MEDFYDEDYYEEEATIECTRCGWQGTDDDLEPFDEWGIFDETHGGVGCPDCCSDQYLRDIPKI